MWRLLFRLALLGVLLGLSGSSIYNLARPIVDHSVAITARRLDAPRAMTSSRLRFVDGWRIAAKDADFGGLSGLLAYPDGLLAVSDKGALVELQFVRGRPRRARIRPLPAGCGQGAIKLQRDSESLARDDAGQIWIGFEWRNAICRTSNALAQASALAVPRQMRPWPSTGGPEAMTRLRDGRMVVIAERARGDGAEVPMLVFAGDPAIGDRPAIELRYRPPAGYRATDVAELPDGSLAVLHRRFQLPLNFSTILSVVPASALTPGAVVRSTAIALLRAPGLHDNFEGLAVDQRTGRTFVWLVSDDNFSPWQATYLLKFELTGS